VLLTRFRIAAAALAAVLGCGGGRDARTGGARADRPDARLPAFDAGSFVQPTRIDNPFNPLVAGTRLVYEGTTIEDDGTAVPHRVVVNVTDLTKVIGGVRTVITWDLDYANGELVEAELAFFAQDSAGTVWRMGEYPEEYEGGKFITAKPWIHGFEGAQAGIEMPAEPRVGTPSYAQGWGPAVGWTDRGQVDSVGQQTCVRAGCYEDVVVIRETSAAEPDAYQFKYYARGLGNVRVGWSGAADPTKETLELARVERLDAAGLSEIRAKAMELERSAYQRSRTVYANTPPAEPGAP
jgi:hypothetical protein